MHRLTTGKLWLILALLLAVTALLPAQSRQITLTEAANQAQVYNNSDLGFEVRFQIGELKLREVQTKAGLFDELYIEGWSTSNDIGDPQLPMLRQLIAVPVGADVRYSVLSQSGRQLDAGDSQLRHRLLPAQESVSKSTDPATLPFILNDAAYAKDSFFSYGPVRIEEIGYLRGVRVFALEFYPVSYNPVRRTLNVTQELTLRVDFEHPDLVATADLLAKTGSREFDRLYFSSLANWRTEDRNPTNYYPTKLLILCPPTYVSAMQTYIDWKKQQGFNVVLTTVGTGGTIANTTSAIKTYMTNVWAAATPQDPAPTYLLIVGDTGTTGDNVNASAATVTNPSSSHVTDNYYVRLQGTDYVPEMYYGRFSVSSATELATVINKTLMFEKTQMPSMDYLGQVVMIAGADASYAPTYGNGQINYGTTHYFNGTNGITSDTYLYPASASSDAQVIANANAGRGYINYTAHGSQTSWADPTFTVANVNAMTNANKYGVWVGNCCLTNAFNYSSPCFGEALIRKANGGAVAYIGGTNSTYWDEDYWWGIGYKTPIQAAAHPYNASTRGAYDAMFHTHGEAFSNWATSVGETVFMGNLAVVQSGSSYQNYYWEIYSIMGDPTLMTYLGVPEANAATYPSQILIGANSITVTAEPYSRVALTLGGVIYGTALVPSTGTLNLSITPFSATGTAKLTITAQNKITIQADIAIIPNSGPYVSASAAYADSNNNIAEYNENGRFNVTFENSGSLAATNVTATLTCSTPGISITDGSESIASLASGASLTINNAFAFAIANNVAHSTNAAFHLNMVSGSNNWEQDFSLQINAPALAFGSVSIIDPAPGNNNGRLDPGETVTVTIPLQNTGGATSPSGSATLSCATSGITVNSGSASFSAISPSGSASLSFSLTAAAGMAVGTVANLNFTATAGAYSASKLESVAVGLLLEDFSAGSFASYPWILGGDAPWTIDNGTYHSASYSAQSGVIGHSQSSILEVTRVLNSSGTLTFWYKVSSESGYDFLKFSIDGTVQNQWSGTVDWTQATFNLAAGTRVLKWEYSKDVSVVSGSDCAWVDDIVFPASTNLYAFYPPQNFSAGGGNGFVALNWQAPAYGTPSGYKIYKNSSLLTTVTGLTYTDAAVVNGTTYSYYLKAVYSGGESEPTPTVTATPNVITSVVLGSGTSTTGTSSGSPINIWYKSLHGQSVYTAAELNSAGIFGPVSITQIGFYVNSAPSLALPNFIVRMKHTSAANVSIWQSATDMATVYSAASYMPTTGGYDMLTLSTPFLWNGSDNIVVDTAFGLVSAYSQSGTVQYSTVSSGYRYARSDNADQTNVFTGGSISNERPNLKIIFVPQQTGPEIAVEPLAIDFGAVAVGGSATEQFSIQNGGGQTLTGSITTPTNYTVAAAARSSDVSRSELRNSAANRNTLAFSVPAGLTFTYNLSFTPTAEASYNGNVVISSNDASEPSLSIAVTGSGFIPNTPPELALPDHFDFDKNGSLSVDFGLYASDPDLDPLSLAVSGNSNILVDISGLNVTFSAVQNWTGTETLSFTLSDGEASESSSVAVIVHPTAMPDWTPVIYPNNSATVYGVVTINWAACALNDVVGAFVGEECRGWAEIVTSGGQAYVTLLVNLAESGETVRFKIYDHSSDTVYPVVEAYALGFGEVLGSGEPIPINGVDYIGPGLVVDHTELEFGAVEVGSSAALNFTLSNSGDLELTGTIVTPTGYSVAELAGRSADHAAATLRSAAGQRNSLDYSVAPGSSVIFAVTFAPTSVAAYDGNVGISSNDSAHPLVEIALSGSGYTAPTAVLDGTALAATLAIGASGTDSFTLSNGGSLDLTYTLSEDPEVGWFSVSPLTGTLSGGAAQLITGSFTAQELAPGLYQTTLLVDSNDPDTPQATVTIELTVTNHAPTLELPDNFSFAMNGSLSLDLAPYVGDEDGHALSLDVSGNTHIQPVIDGLEVTFTATPDWYGAEELVFTVSDGYDFVSDTVLITVTLEYLAAPAVTSCTRDSEGLFLAWEPVPHALAYEVYRATEPYGEYVLLASVEGLQYLDGEELSRAFYRVVAVNEPPARGARP